MAEELKKEFNVDSELIAGSGGIFDVVVNDDKIFSKHNIGRFPDPGEVTKLLKK